MISTCYLFFSFQPGKCGISDVIMRLLAADPSSQIWCGETSKADLPQVRLLLEGGEIRALWQEHKPQNVIFPWTIKPLKTWEKMAFSFVAMQDVARMLWVHEYWYSSVSGKTLPLRQKVKSILQRWQFGRLTKLIHPGIISTTNGLYQHTLISTGYPCEILSNTGTIAVGSKQEGLDYVEAKILCRNTAFVVLSFGYLALSDWDWKTALSDLAKAAEVKGLRAIWVILGRNLDGQVEPIKNFVSGASLKIEVLYLGELSSAEIDHWIWGADAALSGHPYATWEKSTSYLAMTERGLPIIAPRSGFPEDRFAKQNPYVFENFAQLPANSSTHTTYGLVATPAEVIFVRDKLFSSLVD